MKYTDPDGVFESHERFVEVLAKKGIAEKDYRRRLHPFSPEEQAYIDAPLYPPERESYVYFVQDGADGPIKIGYAVDVTKRIASLQTGHHRALRVLLTIPGGPKVERKMHNKFWRSRIRGEWFRPTPMLTAFIESGGDHGT